MKRSRADLPDPAALRALLDPEGRLFVRATPGARSEAVMIEDRRVVVRVRAKAQDGAANEAVLRLLAEALGLASSRVVLLRGATSREKVVRLDQLA